MRSSWIIQVDPKPKTHILEGTDEEKDTERRLCGEEGRDWRLHSQDKGCLEPAEDRGGNGGFAVFVLTGTLYIPGIVQLAFAGGFDCGLDGFARIR